MVAVGGSIGTGLFWLRAPSSAGPGVILSYIIARFSSRTRLRWLSRTGKHAPRRGSFGVYGELVFNQYLGFLCRAAYWAAIAFSIGSRTRRLRHLHELLVPAVRGEIWVVLFAALLLLVNLRSVSSFGRFEFWFSMIKFATIVAFILAGAALLFSAALRRSTPPKADFCPRASRTSAGGILAIYAFGGVEMLAVTTGESRRQRHSRGHAASPSSCLPLSTSAQSRPGGVMPWNHTGVSESPFVSVLRLAKVPAAAYFMNFVGPHRRAIRANAKLYRRSRLLFSMGRSDGAPAG